MHLFCFTHLFSSLLLLFMSEIGTIVTKSTQDFFFSFPSIINFYYGLEFFLFQAHVKWSVYRPMESNQKTENNMGWVVRSATAWSSNMLRAGPTRGRFVENM